MRVGPPFSHGISDTRKCKSKRERKLGSNRKPLASNLRSVTQKLTYMTTLILSYWQDIRNSFPSVEPFLAGQQIPTVFEFVEDEIGSTGFLRSAKAARSSAP